MRVKIIRIRILRSVNNQHSFSKQYTHQNTYKKLFCFSFATVLFMYGKKREFNQTKHGERTGKGQTKFEQHKNI